MNVTIRNMVAVRLSTYTPSGKTSGRAAYLSPAPDVGEPSSTQS
jgi:hypothetical protein